jgi:GTP-binding protein EngB required for normal cell division
LAERLKRESTNIGQISGIEFFKLPMKYIYERYSLGERCNKQHRTILMMGATGSGKTTLINGMINYVLGVEWDDPFRFKLIDEKLKASQAHSQTDAVTAYDIHWMSGMRIDCSLTIIDTPGYGNTKGIEQDKQITKSIVQFLNDRHGIQELDVVGIVAAASQGRLTSTQVYIFDSVLSIFGRDMRDNISLLVTFDDGQGNPAVMSAVREAEVPCLKDAHGEAVIHRFDNSGLMPLSLEYGDYSSNSFTKLYWDICMKNFRKFFVKIGEMETKSLTLTSGVLAEKRHLQATTQGLQSLIQKKLFQAGKLQRVKQFIEENQKQIDAQVKLQIPVEVLEGQKVDLSHDGQYATNCLKCQVTCHYPCSRQNVEKLRKCPAINWLTGNCRSCKKRCSWEKHQNQSYRWEYVVKIKLIFAEDVKKKYEALQKKKLTAQELVESLEKDTKAVESEVMNLVTEAVNSTQRLQEIALLPTPFNSDEYIDILIKNEEADRKPGYEGRIRFLQQLRDQAEILSKIKSG